MDGLEEKKWFVYLGDHHEGPFSLVDVREKMDQGQVTHQSYVWAEGMSDWKMMSDVDVFQPFIGTAKAPAVPKSFAADPVIELSSRPQAFAAKAAPTGPALAASTGGGGGIVVNDSDLRVSSAAADPAPEGKKGGLFKYVLLLFLLIGGTVGYFQLQDANSPMARQVMETLQPYLMQATEKFPALTQYVSPIPPLQDVAPEEYADLRAAASTPQADGPRIAIALSKADPSAPFFYVAGNLPDGTVVDIFVEGEPETLLNQLSFSNRVQVVLSQRLGRSMVVKFPDGKPLPRGQYGIYAVEGEKQPASVQLLLSKLQPMTAKVPSSVTKGFKLLAVRNTFLGGLKDATYTARLKEFHDKLREKATLELGELKQFLASMESQLKATQDKFETVRKIRNPAQRKRQWNEFHTSFLQFANQFTNFFSNKPASVLQDQFFYGSLYAMTERAFRAVSEVHTVEHNSFTQPVEKGALEIQLGQVNSAASTEIAALKAKIDQAEKLQPGPGGLPRRDGL